MELPQAQVLGGFRLIESNAVLTIALGAVERGIASCQQRLNRNQRDRGRHALPGMMQANSSPPRRPIVKMRHEMSEQKAERDALLENKRGAEAPLKLQRRNPLDQCLLDRRLVN